MNTKALSRYAGMSVLIVDDNESNVAVLKALVEQEGLHRVYTETDSRRVQTRLIDCRPDLVLLDLHMPHVNGHEVLRQIKEFAAGSYLPVLVLTVDTETASCIRALKQGAQDYLTKPYDLVEATCRIANLLETRQLYATLAKAGSYAARTNYTGRQQPRLHSASHRGRYPRSRDYTGVPADRRRHHDVGRRL